MVEYESSSKIRRGGKIENLGRGWIEWRREGGNGIGGRWMR